MNRGYACCLEIALQFQIEIWRIHPHEQPRGLSQQTLLQFFADGHNAPVMPQNFDITTHCQRFAWPPGMELLCLHVCPPDACGHPLGMGLAQTLEHNGSQQIARSLTGHHGQIRNMG